MADQTTFDRVCAIVREQAGLDDVELTAETKLSEVGLDSLATVEAVMAMRGRVRHRRSTPSPTPPPSASSSPWSSPSWRTSHAAHPICDLLGIEARDQGGMAWIADASLAAAVSGAGGLGIIAAMNANADWLRDRILELREKTDKPFGVNVMLAGPFADEVAQVAIDEHVPVVVTGAGNPASVP